MDGCSGYCPDCYQRPWCETGRSSCWTEDEKIGEMYLPDSVRKYVSASPVSLEILSKYQAEEDEKFAKWKAANEPTLINPDSFRTDEKDAGF